MSEIVRAGGNQLMSDYVIHNQVVYVSGVVATDKSGDIRAQIKDVLKEIDSRLERAGTDKSKLLTALIWLKDIESDFAVLNELWEQWVHPVGKPARATSQALMASPDVLVEITVSAAI